MSNDEYELAKKARQTLTAIGEHAAKLPAVRVVREGTRAYVVSDSGDYETMHNLAQVLLDNVTSLTKRNSEMHEVLKECAKWGLQWTDSGAWIPNYRPYEFSSRALAEKYRSEYGYSETHVHPRNDAAKLLDQYAAEEKL